MYLKKRWKSSSGEEVREEDEREGGYKGGIQNLKKWRWWKKEKRELRKLWWLKNGEKENWENGDDEDGDGYEGEE